jgi:hypothetical protein
MVASDWRPINRNAEYCSVLPELEQRFAMQWSVRLQWGRGISTAPARGSSSLSKT